MITVLMLLSLYAFCSEKNLDTNEPIKFNFIYKNQNKLNSPSMSLDSLSLTILSKYKLNDDFLLNINSKKYISAGATLLTLGIISILGGATLISLGHYFAFSGLTWMLETDYVNITVFNWSIVWAAMFSSFGKYIQATGAVLTLIFGINLFVIGFIMFIPGIIYLTLGVKSKKKSESYNISPIYDAYGISIKF